MKKRNLTQDYVKASRRQSREEELREHNKLISTRPTRIKKSKKIYKRVKKVQQTLLSLG